MSKNHLFEIIRYETQARTKCRKKTNTSASEQVRDIAKRSRPVDNARRVHNNLALERRKSKAYVQEIREFSKAASLFVQEQNEL